MNFVTNNIDQYTPIKKVNGKYVISWGLKELGNNQGQWYYFILDKKPTKEIIKQHINQYINENVRKSIENNFIWNNLKVSLTIEDQIDINLLFNITNLQNGENLPETIKLKQGKETIYYNIETLDEFKDLLICMNKHIRKCLNQSNELKDSIDYKQYE